MKAIGLAIALLAAVSAAGIAIRRALAMSNTQVHRINQDQPWVTQKGSRS